MKVSQHAIPIDNITINVAKMQHTTTTTGRYTMKAIILSVRKTIQKNLKTILPKISKSSKIADQPF